LNSEGAPAEIFTHNALNPLALSFFF